MLGTAVKAAVPAEPNFGSDRGTASAVELGGAANATGAITFDALAFLRALGVCVLVLSPDNAPLLTSTPRATTRGCDGCRLKREESPHPIPQLSKV